MNCAGSNFFRLLNETVAAVVMMTAAVVMIMGRIMIMMRMMMMVMITVPLDARATAVTEGDGNNRAVR